MSVIHLGKTYGEYLRKNDLPLKEVWTEEQWLENQTDSFKNNKAYKEWVDYYFTKVSSCCSAKVLNENNGEGMCADCKEHCGAIPLEPVLTREEQKFAPLYHALREAWFALLNPDEAEIHYALENIRKELK